VREALSLVVECVCGRERRCSPSGVLLGDAYDNAVLGATVTVLLGDAVIIGVVAIRGGVHTSVDEESNRPSGARADPNRKDHS